MPLTLRVIETYGARIFYTRNGHVAHVLDPASDDLVKSMCGRWWWPRSQELRGLRYSFRQWREGRGRPLCRPCLAVVRERNLYGYQPPPAAEL